MVAAADRTIPFNMPYPAPIQLPYQELTANGAIAQFTSLVILNKAGVLAATLAAPESDGIVLFITAETANAHTVDLATTGINGGSADVGTFGGAVGDCVIVFSANGDWWQVANKNVTWA